MQRGRFTREFKVEAVKLVRDRGVSVTQALRDLKVHENVMCKWVKEIGTKLIAQSAATDWPPISTAAISVGFGVSPRRSNTAWLASREAVY